ncbi:alkaline ceramidase ydc1 [Marasmius crinis-equi]|uniref:Alkaline ceramidase ydc1 n=1 Tax=Marasmius crinis-equi TaxID=585013 RepID=A0ABR3G0V7_9AGAR
MHSIVESVSSPGFFGPVTATLDWCEANYQFSYYIAEIANTFSNLVTVYCALFGAFNMFREQLPNRFLVGYLGFALVGLGSFAFHATLLYEAQLADELPMIYVSSMSLWLLYDRAQGFSTRSLRTQMHVALLITFDVLFTWAYSIYRNPIFHQIVFAILMVTSVLRVIYLLRVSPVGDRIPEEKRRVINKWFIIGAATFAFGFLIWNLDNIYCDLLIKLKAYVGHPIAFLLEGHAWWHILTALGTYYMIFGVSYL